MEFCYITDTHLKASMNVRSGDALEDLSTKLQFVIDYCNKHNCILLHGGDVFDTPSVPDLVKNKVIPIFRSLKTKLYTLAGNHSLLYNSEDYNYKTTYQTFIAAGIFIPLDNQTIDLGECIITNEVPLINRGKPQIGMYHGFLNKDDGKWSFYYQDISSTLTDKTFILLGHDHVAYEPLEFSSNVKIFRPGSFCRQTRDETNMRIPELMHIRVVDGKLQYKMVPISVARPYEEVFKTKVTNITKAQQRQSYEDIINQIRNANVGNMTMLQALEQISTPDVVNYASKLLTDVKIKKQHEKGNL